MSYGSALEHLGFFMLRTPMYPTEEMLVWTKCATAGSDLTTRESWQKHIDDLRGRLKEITGRPEFRQAIRLASPSLLDSIRFWRENPDSKKGIACERSLVKYFQRMCTRPTPFGLFSGWSLGAIETSKSKTVLELEGAVAYKYRCRVDYHLLGEIAIIASKESDISERILFEANTSLVRLGPVWHYATAVIVGDNLKYKMVQIESSPILDWIITRTRGQRVTRRDLGLSIAKMSPQEDPIPLNDAMQFVDELIADGVLVSSLVPPITGGAGLAHLITELERAAGPARLISQLKLAEAKIARCQSSEVAATPEDIEDLEKTGSTAEFVGRQG